MRRIRNVAAGSLVLLLLSGAAGRVHAGDKINVNTASEADLMKLPEMSEARAKAIISYRQSTGELIQVDELRLIPQVKPIYDEIKGLVAVE